MLSGKQEDEFEELCNSDAIVNDLDEIGFEAILAGVKLAIYALNQDTLNEQAFEYVAKYGNWRSIEFPPVLKRRFYVRNYGEEEVQAMEEAGEL